MPLIRTPATKSRFCSWLWTILLPATSLCLLLLPFPASLTNLILLLMTVTFLPRVPLNLQSHLLPLVTRGATPHATPKSGTCLHLFQMTIRLSRKTQTLSRILRLCSSSLFRRPKRINLCHHRSKFESAVRSQTKEAR